MLPIVQREMAAAARRKTTYAFRGMAGFIALVIFFVFWWDYQTQSVSSNPSGQAFLWPIAVVGCVAAVWQGTVRAARCLSEERANGTLGLLFLTPLKTADVVLGKFTTAALLALQIALTLAPMLAVTALFGGVSFGEVARASLWVANVTLFFITSSILASALTASEVAATALSLLFAVATTVFALHDIDTSVDSLSFNPITAWVGIADRSYSPERESYWAGILSGQIAGWAMLGLTALALKNNWHRAEVCPALKFLWTRKPRPIKRGAACKLGKNGPVEWLIVRNVYPPAPLILVVTCIIVSLPFGDSAIRLFMGVVAAFVISVGVVVHSALAVAHAKKAGMLDLLAVAPISDQEIVDGQMRGLKRLFLLASIVTIVWIGLCLPSNTGLTAYYYVVALALNLWVAAYTGIWMALKSKGPVMAVTRNMVLSMILPWVLPLPAVLYLIVLGMIATQTVRRDFRALLAKREKSPSQFSDIAAENDTATRSPLPGYAA